jgi:hypothetical protein
VVKGFDMKQSSIKLLRAGITESIISPGGDPDEHHVKTAAYIIKVLIEECIDVDHDLIDITRYRNGSGYDFLGEVELELNQLREDTNG